MIKIHQRLKYSVYNKNNYLTFRGGYYEKNLICSCNGSYDYWLNWLFR